MRNQDIIKAWKNPELRENGMVHPSGVSFSQLTESEMMEIQGSGDVNPETSTLVATLIEATIASSGWCAGAGAGVAVGIISYKKCF